MSLGIEGNWDDPVEKDELPVGDYLVEVVEPRDIEKMIRTSGDDENNPDYMFVNWTLKVVQPGGGLPAELEGRPMFHSTMFYASQTIMDARAAEGKELYDARSMTYDFLQALGLADYERKDGKRRTVLRPEMKDKKGRLNVAAAFGHKCWVKFEDTTRNGETRRQVTKTWRV